MNLEEESEINGEAISQIRTHLRDTLDVLSADLLINAVDTITNSRFTTSEQVVNVVKMLLNEGVFLLGESIYSADEEEETIVVDKNSSLQTLNSFLVETDVRVCANEGYPEILVVKMIA